MQGRDRSRPIVLGLVALVLVAGGSSSALANHNSCHNEGTPPDVWTGIAGADLGTPAVGVCVGDFTLFFYLEGSGLGTTVRSSLCDTSQGPGNCDPVLGATGDPTFEQNPGPACFLVGMTVNGGPVGPFQIGVCDP